MKHLASRSPDARQVTFATVLVCAALGVVIGLDIFRVEGDIDRMNSVFKLYLQVWVLLALASAYLAWRILRTGVVERTMSVPWARAWGLGPGPACPRGGCLSRARHPGPAEDEVRRAPADPRRHGLYARRRVQRPERHDRPLRRLRRHTLAPGQRSGLARRAGGADPELPLGRPHLHLHRPPLGRRLEVAPGAAALGLQEGRRRTRPRRQPHLRHPQTPPRL